MITYALLWFILLALAFLNAILREVLYAQAAGLYWSHQISVFTGIALLGAAMWFIIRRWPVGSLRRALLVGVLWLVMTEVFEWAMIVFFQGKPLAAFLQAHNLMAGELWPLFLLWLLVGPVIIHRLQTRR